MSRDNIVEQSQLARELVAATLQPDSFDLAAWSQLVREFSTKYQTRAVFMLCAVAGAAVRDWARHAQRPEAELLDGLHEHSYSLGLPDGKIYANCVALVREQLREKPDQPKLEAAASACGAFGERAVGHAAKLAAGALGSTGEARGMTALEALQALAVVDELSLYQQGEQ